MDSYVRFRSGCPLSTCCLIFFVRLLLCVGLQRIRIPKLVIFWTRTLESLFLLAHGVNHLRRTLLLESRKYLLLSPPQSMYLVVQSLLIQVLRSYIRTIIPVFRPRKTMKSSVMPPVRTTSTRVAYQRPGDTEKSHTARKLQELNIATPYCNAAASEHGSFASDQSRTPTQGGMGSFKMNVQGSYAVSSFIHTAPAIVQVLTCSQDSSRARPSFATANKDNYQKSSGPYTRSMPSAAATSRASNYSASNMYPDSYVAPRHRDVDRLKSAGNPAGSRGNTYTKPDQPRSQLYARSLFRPGMIVRAALHGKL